MMSQRLHISDYIHLYTGRVIQYGQLIIYLATLLLLFGLYSGFQVYLVELLSTSDPGYQPVE